MKPYQASGVRRSSFPAPAGGHPGPQPDSPKRWWWRPLTCYS